MTTSTQTNTHEKARALRAGFLDVLNSFDDAPQQGQTDNMLSALQSIYELSGIPRKLLHIDRDITITSGDDDTGKKLPTTGMVGLVLSDNQDTPASLMCVTPNNQQRPIITDRVQPSALVIGELSHDRELIAADNLHDGIKLANALIADNVTVLVSPDASMFAETVKHFAEAYPVTVLVTADKQNKVCKPLAGANVKAVITAIDCLTHLEQGLSYQDILNDQDTHTRNLQDDIWGEPEPLANDPSQPTAFPIDAFTGLLRRVVEAVSHYAQVPPAMAGYCVLGALAHIGQRFIDAPMGHEHKPASLIIIIEGESGSGKTKTMSLTHAAIKDYERVQYERYIQDLDTWEADKASLSGKELAEYLNNYPKPQNPKSLFDDATIEPILDRFISRLMTSASWTTDEAGQFFNGHTMKGDTAGNALSALTKLYSDGAVSRLRSQKSANAIPQTDAYNVRMTLLLQGQRVVLEQALTDPLMNGQGFLARAMIACPPDLRGQRVWNDSKRRQDSPYNDSALQAYWERCNSLLDPSPANLPSDSTGTPQRVKMQWAAGAEQAFYDYMQQVENRQASGQTLEYLRAYASRMAENASRIASLMAFFDERKAITSDDLQRASKLVEYSTAERLRYLDASPTGEQNDSEKLSSWLVDKAKNKQPPILNKSFITQNAPNALRGKKLHGLLSDLESAGHIRMETDGRRRLVLINPKLFAA
ncbi:MULTISPECIES: DUF3987 domain-containing protein [unclassified Psychrobacter]|uniref:DUF3987 domain-containing protein n=1 Tax=unclassified Psychrobacter TaxID=196806 RepID=UPI0018F4761C|nr:MULTISPECIES: DUF3987 domain-containing protein [unclassified Psychrobacter]